MICMVTWEAFSKKSTRSFFGRLPTFSGVFCSSEANAHILRSGQRKLKASSVAACWRDGHIPSVYNIDIKPSAVVNPYLPKRWPPNAVVKEVVIAPIGSVLWHGYIVIPLEMNVISQLCQLQAAARNILQKLQHEAEAQGAVSFQPSTMGPPDNVVFA